MDIKQRAKDRLKRSPWFWGLVSSMARLVPDRFFSHIPKAIVIDVTNVCNIRCPSCPVPRELTRPRGLMAISTFQRLVDDLVAAGKKRPTITFNWSGEPTMNPALPDMVRYATERGFYTILSTNATRLTDDLCAKLVDAKLDVATLCIDGADAKAHESYRIGSKFESVKANIERFVRINRERSGSTTCQIQTLITAYSEGQTQEIEAWAGRIGADTLSLKTFSVSLDGRKDETERSGLSHFLPKRSENLRNRNGISRSICTTPLTQAVIYWDGSLGLCCIDMDKTVAMPSILSGGLVAALRSKEARQGRKRGLLKKHAICDGCTLGDADEVTRKVALH